MILLPSWRLINSECCINCLLFLCNGILVDLREYCTPTPCFLWAHSAHIICTLDTNISSPSSYYTRRMQFQTNSLASYMYVYTRSKRYKLIIGQTTDNFFKNYNSKTSPSFLKGSRYHSIL